MTKMICISEEDYKAFSIFVMDTHDILLDLKEWGNGQLRPEEGELLDESKRLMERIGIIDEKIKEE